MSGTSSIPEITTNPIIYPSLTHPVFMQFERWMIEHHVESLIEVNLIEERKGKFVAI